MPAPVRIFGVPPTDVGGTLGPQGGETEYPVNAGNTGVDPAPGPVKKLVNDGYSVTESETVYVAMYIQSVRRTNMYLSEAEQQAVDAQAAGSDGPAGPSDPSTNGGRGRSPDFSLRGG
jgi:hypothetical protein